MLDRGCGVPMEHPLWVVRRPALCGGQWPAPLQCCSRPFHLWFHLHSQSGQEHCHRAEGAEIWRHSAVTQQGHARLPTGGKAVLQHIGQGLSTCGMCPREVRDGRNDMVQYKPLPICMHQQMDGTSAHWTERCLQQPCCLQAQAGRAAEDPSTHARHPPPACHGREQGRGPCLAW